MRFAAALTAAALLLAACSGPTDMTMSGLAGPGNTAALNAAVACRNDDALALAKGAANTDEPSEELFSQFLQAALHTEAGEDRLAAQAIQTATDDPQMNPDARSAESMAEGATAVLAAIRAQREAATGSPDC